MVSHPHEPATSEPVSSPLCYLSYLHLTLLFPAQYSVCSFFKEAGTLVQSALTKKQLKDFKKLSWGHLIPVQEIQFMNICLTVRCVWNIVQ
ncbi:unnamed protein product [Cuscuta europaea]|uniref:Uncharacterized protein n=1 Tax=Cuscuta europaea TaxID=41803 RepID=A0A9P0ZHM2_CUSEU|nr:unnamed protein product [Cuscuta europaea]